MTDPIQRGDQVRLTDGTLARVAGAFSNHFLILHAGQFFSVDPSEVEAIVGRSNRTQSTT